MVSIDLADGKGKTNLIISSVSGKTYYGYVAGLNPKRWVSFELSKKTFLKKIQELILKIVKP